MTRTKATRTNKSNSANRTKSSVKNAPLYSPRPVRKLTLRQRQILELIARGKPSRQIAKTLGVSKTTIDTHIRRAYRKLGVEKQTSAVLALMQSSGSEEEKQPGSHSARPLGQELVFEFCPTQRGCLRIAVHIETQEECRPHAFRVGSAKRIWMSIDPDPATLGRLAEMIHCAR